jgi:hypothetical protein
VKSTQSFATLAKDAPGGYREIARLSDAGVLLAQNKRDEALAIYKAIAAEDRGPLGGLALIRAGWVLAETAPQADVQTLLAPLLAPVKTSTGWFDAPKTVPNPWRFAAREVLAYAAYHNGDMAKAQAGFKMLADDKDAPDGARHRAAAMATFLRNGGLANYGTVPPPPPAAPPSNAPPASSAPPAPNAPPAPSAPPATNAPTGTPPK